ncbi:MAG TPA: phospho-sugar mutase [Phycisphaerae bacterium]|nr:phospho-sugar mutase [Phycisphaerae bacterium]
MDPAIQSAVDRWLADPAIAPIDQQEVRDLLARGDAGELADRFYRDLEFGTGGLRGIMGAGLNRMNPYTVGAAAQGLANYIAKGGEAARRGGVAIAYDCRRMSDAFARRVAEVMAGNGIRAYLFEALRPTPELSFAVRHLKCTSGVVVTASHNPPAYNGFKAYWSDGGQVVPPHDAAIIEEVRRVGGFSNVRAMPLAEAKSQGLVNLIGHEIDEAFLEKVQQSTLAPDLCQTQGKQLKIVFSALHGTGSTLVPEALRRRGFVNVSEVAEQARPDGEFPTVKSPNPEEGAALAMAIDLARRESADLVIASDPDADRVGIAVRDATGNYPLVTGNQIAAILTYYLCEQLTRSGRFPNRGVVLSTIVSSDLMKTIARSYGAEVVETLTGFKWIAAKIGEFERDGSGRRFIFGAEESYGYMPCDYVRDKDAVTSAAFLAEAAAFAASQGQTLLTLLDSLFAKFGFHQEGAKSFTMPGQDGATRIAALMDGLRRSPPRTMGGRPVQTWADIQTGEVRELATGIVVGRYELPASDVIMLTLDDKTKVIARPSGTEPKIKFYILAKEPGDDLATARMGASIKIEAISHELSMIAGEA